MINSAAPVGDCVFGDDVIVNLQVLAIELPSVQMDCESVITYISSLNNSRIPVYIF